MDDNSQNTLAVDPVLDTLNSSGYLDEDTCRAILEEKERSG